MRVCVFKTLMLCEELSWNITNRENKTQRNTAQLNNNNTTTTTTTTTVTSKALIIYTNKLKHVHGGYNYSFNASYIHTYRNNIQKKNAK